MIAAAPIVGGLVEMLCRLGKLPRTGAGSTTMKKEEWERGLEPDECCCLGDKSVAAMRSDREFDADRDPPPDLLVEADVTNRCLDRMPGFASLKRNEVWRHDGEKMHFFSPVGLIDELRTRLNTPPT